MNNLNSVLIEGNLLEDPKLSYDSNGKALCSFDVACVRSEKEDGGTVQRTVTTVPITTREGRLAEVCVEYLKMGRGVRVVGRLAMAEGLFIFAEHVEFKPSSEKEIA
jgi:single-strand DNA-binding protein